VSLVIRTRHDRRIETGIASVEPESPGYRGICRFFHTPDAGQKGLATLAFVREIPTLPLSTIRTLKSTKDSHEQKSQT
jgi:hypothetical protein